MDEMYCRLLRLQLLLVLLGLGSFPTPPAESLLGGFPENMTTPIESKTNEEMTRLPSEPTQDPQIIAPVMMAPSLMGGHTDRAPNLTENTTKQEDVYHYYKLWREYNSYTVDTTTKSIDAIDINYYFFANNFGNFGMLGRLGVKFDLEFRIQIFSSSAQQGAVLIALLPFKEGVIDSWAEYYDNQKFPTSDPMFLTQYNSQIIPLGQDEEIIVPVKWNYIFPFHLRSNHNLQTLELSSLDIRMFDGLKVVEGGHNSFKINILMRCTNIEFVGSGWTPSINMGSLVIK